MSRPHLLDALRDTVLLCDGGYGAQLVETLVDDGPRGVGALFPPLPGLLRLPEAFFLGAG